MVVRFRVEMGSLSSPKPHWLAQSLVCTRVWCEVEISHLDPGKELGVQGGRYSQHSTDVKDAVSPGDVGVEGGWWAKILFNITLKCIKHRYKGKSQLEPVCVSKRLPMMDLVGAPPGAPFLAGAPPPSCPDVVSYHSCPLLLQIALSQMEASSSPTPALPVLGTDGEGHKRLVPLPQCETDSVSDWCSRAPRGPGWDRMLSWLSLSCPALLICASREPDRRTSPPAPRLEVHAY